MTNLKLSKIALDRLLQFKTGEECEIIVLIDKTELVDTVENYLNWDNEDVFIENYSPIQPNEEFYVGEEFPCIGDCNMGIHCQTCGSNGQGVGIFESSEMTPEQSSFHGICVDAEVKKIKELMILKHNDIRSDEAIKMLSDYYMLCSEYNTNIKPSLEDYVFYIKVRRTR